MIVKIEKIGIIRMSVKKGGFLGFNKRFVSVICGMICGRF